MALNTDILKKIALYVLSVMIAIVLLVLFFYVFIVLFVLFIGYMIYRKFFRKGKTSSDKVIIDVRK